MHAIDLKSRKVVWKRPSGTTKGMGLLGIRILFDLRTCIISGVSVLQRGLVSLDATTDQYIRSLDERSGRTLWEGGLRAGGNASPLTYLGKAEHIRRGLIHQVATRRSMNPLSSRQNQATSKQCSAVKHGIMISEQFQGRNFCDPPQLGVA